MSKKTNSGCGTAIVVLLIMGFISTYWPVVLGFVIIVAIAYGLYKRHINPANKIEKQNVPIKVEGTVKSNSPVLIQNAPKVNERELVLSAGKYVGGRDIKTGIYDLSVISGSGIVEIDSQDKFYEFLSRNKENSYNNLEISDGATLKINTGMRVKLYNHRDYITGEKIKNEEHKIMTSQFDYMDGHSFEYFCADVLRQNGYSDVKVTQGSGDQGVDILAERDNIKYAIQCKHYSQPVGNKAVQEIYTGMRFYHCHVGIIMTNNYFTQSAKDLAKENGIVLWDREYLLKFLGTKEETDAGKADIIKDVSVVNDDQIENSELEEIEEDYKGDVNIYGRGKAIYPPGIYVVGEDIETGK